MIVTEFYDGQGLGNQLWVYAASRSIAEELNVPFSLVGVEKFKGNTFIDLKDVIGLSTSENNNIKKNKNWNEFHEEYFYDPDLKYISSGYDSRVLELKGINKLDGLFQSEKYFFGNIDKIKKYFELNEKCKNKNIIDDQTCVINLRGGEYKKHKKFILPESYWKSAIKNMIEINNIKKFLVVTDDVRYARSMFPKIEVLDGNISDCYATLYNAKYLILSNSTFSYFPIKTSNNSRFVIAPKYWARYGNPFKRWASTANLYESWMWQATDGCLLSFQECLDECKLTEKEYESKYYVRTTMESINRPSLKNIFPSEFKNTIKKSLSLVFPRYFG